VFSYSSFQSAKILLLENFVPRCETYSAAKQRQATEPVILHLPRDIFFFLKVENCRTIYRISGISAFVIPPTPKNKSLCLYSYIPSRIKALHYIPPRIKVLHYIPPLIRGARGVRGVRAAGG
jgi:hypothetical protein